VVVFRLKLLLDLVSRTIVVVSFGNKTRMHAFLTSSETSLMYGSSLAATLSASCAVLASSISSRNSMTSLNSTGSWNVRPSSSTLMPCRFN
jgi:hypothetical protein